ncbi:hypothetical protein K7432_004747 [Basidiobolus ranarum]|uniref:Uncharacterized protein n=1 Tax=Basidiobolus ranarum TaxID=34480 RepID=A0ABR2WXM7_9FUNG
MATRDLHLQPSLPLLIHLGRPNPKIKEEIIGNVLDFVKAVVTSLSLEIQENILFFVGDVGLYFDFSHKSNHRLRTLITKNDGAGFVLEDAIKKRHKPLIRWLLTTYIFPKEYSLVSAVSNGDLFTLIYIVSLIGDDYTEFDEFAKLLCIQEGKMALFEYLYERNKNFSPSSGNYSYPHIYHCIINGMSNSTDVCSWYLKNKKICPPIGRETLLLAYLENGSISRATQCLSSQNGKRLLSKSLSKIQIHSVKEETFQWLIVSYSNEDHVLTYVAKACATLGYVGTLEELFKEPYNVPVEYDMFASIESLAVAKILHKYAYKRDCISNALFGGCIQNLDSRFTTYKNPEAHQLVLKVFMTGGGCLISRMTNTTFRRVKSEEVLLFLVDLASITSDTRQVKKYAVYAIHNGFLRLLKKLRPYLQETDMMNLRGLDIHQSNNEEMIEYILELGIIQTRPMSRLQNKFSLRYIQKLIQ